MTQAGVAVGGEIMGYEIESRPSVEYHAALVEDAGRWSLTIVTPFGTSEIDDPSFHLGLFDAGVYVQCWALQAARSNDEKAAAAAFLQQE